MVVPFGNCRPEGEVEETEEVRVPEDWKADCAEATDNADPRHKTPHAIQPPRNVRRRPPAESHDPDRLRARNRAAPLAPSID